jgi:hypothetical protein
VLEQAIIAALDVGSARPVARDEVSTASRCALSDRARPHRLRRGVVVAATDGGVASPSV